MLCNPLDLAKVLMTAERTRGQYSNSMHALACVAQQEGVRKGLWRASGVTVLRAALASAAQLTAYDYAKALLRGGAGSAAVHEATWVHLGASVAAAVAYTTASAPADLIKSRVMAQPCGPERLGPMGCAVQTVRSEGIGALWTGWAASTGRLLPVVLVVFPLMERLRLLLGVSAF